MFERTGFKELLFLQIFEWWYFKKYGISFIEQVSLSHLSPLLGRQDGSTDGGGDGSEISNGVVPHSVSGKFYCKLSHMISLS